MMRGVDAPISVEQGAMAPRVEQPAIVMLAMDLDQSLADLAQQLHAHAGVIDEGAAPAVSPLEAAQDQRVIGGNAVLGQEREHRMAAVQIEHRRDLALACAAPHQ